MRSAPPLAGKRKTRPGPEADLLDRFLRNGLPFEARTQPVVFKEPEMPTGFPDLVAVYPSQRKFVLNSFRTELTAQHLKLLYHFSTVRSSDLKSLSKKLSYSPAKIAMLVNGLLNSDLIYSKGERIYLRSLENIFATKKIVSIEAKISKWQDAIYQAIANTWFASHSYILLPDMKSFDLINPRARAVGVGVLSFDGKKTKILVPAKNLKLPGSYGSWMLNEWTLRHLFG